MTYEHRCPNCKNEDGSPFDFEHMRPISEASKQYVSCPKCGADSKKIMSVNAKMGSWTRLSFISD
jgi:putative FmdB family regulatory protein